MDIYWIENKERKGPVNEAEIITLLRRGEVFSYTLAWHKGCKGWIPLCELPAVSSYFQKNDDELEDILPEGKDISQNIKTADEDLSDVRVVRYVTPPLLARIFARLFDFLFYNVVAYFVIFNFIPSPVEYIFKGGAGYWIIGGSIVVEILCLYIWGTTLGKFICKIRVISTNASFVPLLAGVGAESRTSQNNNLGFWQCVKRTLYVCAFGVGFYVFPSILLFGVFSYFIMRKAGIATWDYVSQTTPVYKGTSPYDWVIILPCLVLLMMALGMIIQPWMPEIQQMMQEMARRYQSK